MGIASRSIALSSSPRGRLDGFIARPLPLFIAIFILFLLVFGTSIFLLPKRYGQLIVGDGIYYYVYLRSAVLDGDIEFTNDYALYQAFNDQDLRKKEEMLSRKTPNGMAANFFSVGPAVLWSPAFIATHAFATLLGQAKDGFSYWYQAPLLFLSIAYGFIGILLTYLVTAGIFSRFAAFVSILGIWLATNVVYYMGVSPSASHVLSMFTCSLFVYLWWRGLGKRTRGNWFLWGLSAGLMAMVRWQDGLIAVLALFEWIAILRSKTQGEENRARASTPAQHRDDTSPQSHAVALTVDGLIFSAGALIAFLPQMLAWNILYGSPLTIPQGEGFLQYFRPEIWNVWFSSKRGLFPWSPVILFAVIGFVPLYRKNKTLGASAIAIFVLETYTNSIVSDWWGGEAFGARRFISLIPFFALGLAAFVDWIRPRVPANVILVALGAFVVWNSLFLLQYSLWLHGIGHISALPTLQEMTIDKFTAPFQALEKLRTR